jgi:hypothetical protein
MYFTLLHLFPNLMFRNYHNRKKKINKEWTTKNRLNFAASAAAAAAAAETAARSAAVAAAASGYPTFQYHHVSGSDIKDEPLRVAMMVYAAAITIARSKKLWSTPTRHTKRLLSTTTRRTT